MVIIFSTLLTLAGSAGAAVVGITGINVNPALPTEFDSINILGEGFMGYAMDIEFWSSDFSISTTSVEINYYFVDSHVPGGIRLPISDDWTYTTSIATLTEASYDVIAKAWVDEINGIGLYLADTYTTTFTVTPEPGTILLLAFGSLMLRKKRNVTAG